MRNFALAKLVMLQRSQFSPASWTFSSRAIEPTAIVRLDGTSISSQQVDDTINRLIAAAHVTGAGVALFRDGNIVYQGLRFSRHRKEVAAHTGFRHDFCFA